MEGPDSEKETPAVEAPIIRVAWLVLGISFVIGFAADIFYILYGTAVERRLALITFGFLILILLVFGGTNFKKLIGSLKAKFS